MGCISDYFPVEFVSVKNDDDLKSIAINVGGNALIAVVAAVALTTLAKLVVFGGSLISFIAVPILLSAALVYGATTLIDKLFQEKDLSPETGKPMPPVTPHNSTANLNPEDARG